MISQRWIDEAIKQARKSKHTRFKLGAVILRKNKLVSVGFNQSKTHPLLKNYFGGMHAECAALIKSNGEGDTLLVVRINKAGTHLRTSKPCAKCMDFIRKYDINTIYYVSQSYRIRKMILEKQR